MEESEDDVLHDIKFDLVTLLFQTGDKVQAINFFRTETQEIDEPIVTHNDVIKNGTCLFSSNEIAYGIGQYENDKLHQGIYQTGEFTRKGVLNDLTSKFEIEIKFSKKKRFKGRFDNLINGDGIFEYEKDGETIQQQVELKNGLIFPDKKFIIVSSPNRRLYMLLSRRAGYSEEIVQKLTSDQMEDYDEVTLDKFYVNPLLDTFTYFRIPQADLIWRSGWKLGIGFSMSLVYQIYDTYLSNRYQIYPHRNLMQRLIVEEFSYQNEAEGDELLKSGLIIGDNCVLDKLWMKLKPMDKRVKMLLGNESSVYKGVISLEGFRDLFNEEIHQKIGCLFDEWPQEMKLQYYFYTMRTLDEKFIIRTYDASKELKNSKVEPLKEIEDLDSELVPFDLKPHKCIMLSIKGRVYSGEARGAFKHGWGEMEYSEHFFVLKAKGLWRMDNLVGEGARIEYRNGAVYEGCVMMELRHGKGKMVFANGESYDGDWVFGVRQGTGVYRWKNGDEYKGEFRMGMPFGQGEMKLVNGDVYEGQFVNGGFVDTKVN